MQESISANIVDVTNICHTIPERPERLVNRDNLLGTIERIFAQGLEAIFAEGEEGAGKTTLLAEFVRRHALKCVCLFIRPISRYAYDPSVLRYDMCNQLQWLLHSTQLPEDVRVDDALFRHLLLEVQRRAARSSGDYYMVIDGLDSIPEQDRKAILDMTPLGMRGVPILFSGDPKIILGKREKKLNYKSFPVPEFILHESMEYLKDVISDHEKIQELHTTWKGTPGHLASVRRLIASGLPVAELFENLPEQLKDLFEMEWSKVNDSDEALKQVLALLAYGNVRFTKDMLSSVFKVEKKEIDNILNSLPFITSAKETGEVAYASESFRSFAASRLKEYQESVLSLHLNYLFENPYGPDSLTVLPDYLDRVGKYDQLVKYLADEYFLKLLDRSGTLAPLEKQAGLAVKVARKLNNTYDLVRFSVSKSAICGLLRTSTSTPEIKALLALDDYENATLLANSTNLKEDRLHLLVVIAKAKREQGLHPEAVLIDQINQLYNEIDPSMLGSERAMEIAADLLVVSPELAISLVEKSTSVNDGENALDWAFVRLSIAALAAKQDQSNGDDAAERLRARISNRDLKGLFSTISIFTVQRSAAEVLAESRKLERTSDQLFLLRKWCLEHYMRPDAIDVVEHALNVAISTTGYSANASFYREIATALPFISNDNKVKELIGVIDGQKQVIEKQGPTNEYVRLQLTLAATEGKWSLEIAASRLVNLYLDVISGISDLSIKSGCLAWFMAALNSLDESGDIESKEGLREIATSEFHVCFNELLKNTAEHYQATKEIILALSSGCPTLAVELANALNTTDRREEALTDVVINLLDKNSDRESLQTGRNIIKSIPNLRLQDHASMALAEAVSVGIQKACLDDGDIFKTIDDIESMHGATKKCHAFILIISALYKYGKFIATASNIQKLLDTKLESAWDSIDSPWLKIDAAYQIVASLAPFDRSLANKYMERVKEIRSLEFISSKAVTDVTMFLTNLMLRAYRALLQANLATVGDLESLANYIKRAPGSSSQAILWGKLASILYLSGDHEKCKEIVFAHVRPVFDAISEQNRAHKFDLLVKIAPVLWVTSRVIAEEEINQLPASYRDDAYYSICQFILSKCPLGEPYDITDMSKCEADYGDFINVLDLSLRIECDNNLFTLVKGVCGAVANLKKAAKVQSGQLADICARVEKVIAKFPTPGYIRHEGYRILGEAQYSRIRAVKTDFTALIRRAKAIPNTADAAYVLSLIAEVLPTREHKTRLTLLHDANNLTQTIPAIYDRMDRCETLAEVAWDIDPVFARKCLKDAFMLGRDGSDEGVEKKRRDLIDLAYRIDPDLPGSLASITDTDPAQKRLKSVINNRVKFLSHKKKFIDEKNTETAEDDAQGSDYPRMSWKLLSDMNSGRVGPVHIERIKEILEISANYPFREAFPMLAWSVENVRMMYSKTEQASEYIRAYFDSLNSCFRFMEKLLPQSVTHGRWDQWLNENKASSFDLIIQPGERDKAIDFLGNWLRKSTLDSLKICDAFFGPEDLEVLEIIRQVNPDCKVQILTSEKHQTQLALQRPWEDSYRTYWRKNISEQDPPDTEIVIAGIEGSGESPIHDRWWITSSGGLRLGTSFNSLGKKVSELSIVERDSACGKAEEVDRYLTARERSFLGKKVRYTLFNI